VSVARTPGLARYVLVRPSRLVVVTRAGWRLRRTGWWHRAPFLPVPDARYWEFRAYTAYGEGAGPTPSEVVDAARWTIRQRVAR